MVRAICSHNAKEGRGQPLPMASIKRPKVRRPQVVPLGHDTMLALLSAAGRLRRERALLLLMRYSGLAIRDAATLRRDAGRTDSCFVLWRATTGELVTAPRAAPVRTAPREIARTDRPHYFWIGAGQPMTAVKYWRKQLNLVAREAGADGFRPHQLRRTFAVELLQAGTMIQGVFTLLGHSGVTVTVK